MNFSVIDFLRPKKVDSPRRRLGSFHDGGYIVLENILTKRLYSFGVGNESSFESEFIKMEGAKAHMFDHTVDFNVHPIFSDKMVFHKKALAMKRTPHGDTVMGHVEANGDKDNPITVTIDVEGFELDYFQVDHDWDNVYGLLVEFHIFNKGDREKLIKCLQNISKHFLTYHIHGNNWELGTFEIEGKNFPKTFEVGFISRRFTTGDFEFDPANESLPIKGLDYPCKPGHEDIDLDYLFKD